MDRIAEIRRKTGETDIYARVNIDGSGRVKLAYPIGFMEHMLTAFAVHGLFDLEIDGSGDTGVDQHHLVEDSGIALGTAFAKALGDKRGIARVGSCLYPMDETLVQAACDLSGRAFLVFNGLLSGIPLVSAGHSFQTDTVEDFWQGFVGGAACALHIDVIRGRSDHHKVEGIFKAAARALRQACAVDPRAGDAVPSTKGSLIEGGVIV
jgi:imidazoleglycerol-phosphate dehydratase